MTKSPQRAHHASKPKPATRQQKNETRTSGPLKASKRDIGIPIADYKPTDITPEEFFKAWSRKQRGDLIELLIESLDAEAGDADFEETGDAEPSLGFQAGDIFVGRGCESGGSGDDREDEHDGREPDSDEGGEGAVEDDEPSLGWTTSGAMVGDSDRESDAGDEPESDPAELGIADRDGILEQFGHDPRFGTFYPGAAAI